jgi:hypothetical protein
MFSPSPYYYKPEVERREFRFLKHINAGTIALILTALVALLAPTHCPDSASIKGATYPPSKVSGIKITETGKGGCKTTN